MDKVFEHLWVEKFRPTKLEDVVLSDKNRRYFESIKIKGEIPHLLFSGSPGIGKSCCAKIIVNELLDCQYLYINASDESGVDTIRTKVKNFAQTLSIDGKLKCVILEECLEENTLVWCLRNGDVCKIPIKELNDKEDLVKSYDIKHDIIVWRPFTLIDQGIQDVYEIEFENGEKVECTETHKWYVYDKNKNIIRKKLKDIMKDGDEIIVTK